jgi:hypothetical protein
MYLLFSHIQAAREIAYALRGEWDSCNGVVFSTQLDEAALNNAIALIELELGEKIKDCCEGSYCPLSWGLLDNPLAGTIGFTRTGKQIPEYYLLDTSVERSGFYSREIESDPQVLDLFARLEPGTLLLNPCEYSLSPAMEAAFWRIAQQGRKYGIRTIKVETSEQGLALSHALNQYKIVDLFDYQN